MHIMPRTPRIGTRVLFGVLCSFVACAPEPGFVPPDLVPAGTVVASARVGALPVSVSVSNDGAALGAIPFWTPEGRAGIAPNLALNYSSAAGNGLVGVGWSLSGFSSIARCPPAGARFDESERHNNIRFDDTDRYCLNGTLLVPTPARSSSTSEALAAYHPENDLDTLVEAYRSDPVGPPQSFKAWSNGGQVTTFQPTVYGRRVSTETDDGALRSDVGSSTLEWGASRVEDVSGNFMTVAWRTLRSVSGVEAVPDYITYTDGPLAGAANRVEFTYEGRPDTDLLYVNGLRLSRARRLAKVLVYGLDENERQNLVRDYRLSYRADISITHRSLLQSITTCDGAGVCLPATTFAYEPGSEAVRVRATGIDDSGVATGDLDGDGRDDVISQPLTMPRVSWSVWPGMVDGLPSIPTGRIEDDAISSPIVADFNGDLYADIFEGTFATGWHYRPNDVGNADPFQRNQVLPTTDTPGTGWGTRCSSGSTCAAGLICTLVDGNGVCVAPGFCPCTTHDGCTGAAILADAGERVCAPKCDNGSPCSTGMTCAARNYVAFYSDTGQERNWTGQVCVPDPYETTDASPLYVVDTNGNGILEAIVAQRNGAWRFERNTHENNTIGSSPRVAASVASDEDGGSPQHVLDLDGDGFTDLVGGSGLPSAGVFERYQRVTIKDGGVASLNERPRGNQEVFVDVNGDSLPDIIDFNMSIRTYGFGVGVRLNTGRCVEKPFPGPCVLGFEAPYDAFGGMPTVHV